MSSELKCSVIARFPDVTHFAVRQGEGGEKETGGGALFGSKRLIGQELSFKLLAGATVVLLLVAILPNLSRHKAPSVEPAMQFAAEDAFQQSSLTNKQEAASAQTIPSRPITVVAAVPERTADIAPPLAQPNESKESLSTSAEPQMSAWPNPAQSSPLPDARRSPPAVQPEVLGRAPAYQADARATGGEQLEPRKY